MAPNDAFRCVRSPTSIAENREKRDRHVVDSCSPGCPYFPAHTHTLHPPNTMSAFLAGSPVVAKVAAKPVAKRNVTVRAAAPSEYVPRLPSRSFILLARTLSHAAEPRNVATRRRASWLTFDAPPRPNPPRVVNNSGVTRRAAVAGVLAFFVAQPVRPFPIASLPRFFRDSPFPSTSVSSPSSPRRPPPRPSACARRSLPRRTAPTPGPCPSPRARGSASTRPPARSSRTSRRRS